MKLEKLSDTQIRCTLSKEDLTQRQLHLSELAYGSEKAKELFRDMMQQALDIGIASIISGIFSASNPSSADACCIMSRNNSFAFSEP